MKGLWIIVDRATGKPLFKTPSRTIANTADPKKYAVLTRLQWLRRTERKHNPILAAFLKEGAIGSAWDKIKRGRKKRTRR